MPLLALDAPDNRHTKTRPVSKVTLSTNHVCIYDLSLYLVFTIMFFIRVYYTLICFYRTIFNFPLVSVISHSSSGFHNSFISSVTLFLFIRIPSIHQLHCSISILLSLSNHLHSSLCVHTFTHSSQVSFISFIHLPIFYHLSLAIYPFLSIHHVSTHLIFHLCLFFHPINIFVYVSINLLVIVHRYQSVSIHPLLTVYPFARFHFFISSSIFANKLVH